MKKIQLTPTELKSQAAEMNSLMREYESLFGSVTNILNDTNNHWSANLSHNFSGKITSAQKGFSTVVDMLQYGATAANSSAETFEEIDIQLSKVLNGTTNSTTTSSKSKKTENEDKDDITDVLKLLKSILSTQGKFLEKDEYSQASDVLSTLLCGYETIQDVLTGKIDKDTYAGAISGVLDIFKEFEGGERLGVAGVMTDFVSETMEIFEMSGPLEFLQNANEYIDASGKLGMEIGKYWGLVKEGLEGSVAAQEALTCVTTIATMGTKLVGDVAAFNQDGEINLEDFGKMFMDVGAYGGSSLVKGLTFGILDIDAEGAINTYKNYSEQWSDYLYDSGLPLWAQCVGDVVASPAIFVVGTAQVAIDTIAKPLKILEKGTSWVLDQVSNNVI